MRNFHPTFNNLPVEWRLHRIDQLFNIQQGKQVSKKNRIGNSQRHFLRTKNVFWGKMDLKEVDEMNFTEQEEDRLELKFGDLLVCEGGDIGRTAIWRNELNKCYYQNHLHRMRAIDIKAVESEFALYWLWYAFNIGKIYFGRGNITTIPNLSQSRLAELPLPVPPLSEQQKIAHILSTVQRAIEQQERLIQVTTELKKALMHKLFTEGTRGEPQKETEIGLVPESWEVVNLGDICDLRKELCDPKLSQQDVYVGLEHIKSGRFFLTEYGNPNDVKSSKSIFHRNDILYGKLRPYLEKAVIAKTEGICSTDILVLKPINNIESGFIVSLIHSNNFVEYANKTTSGVNHPRTSWQNIKSFIFGLPNQLERETISSVLISLENKIEIHKRQRDCLRELFHNLLHQLMTAQIRVHEIEFEGLDD